MSPGYGLLALLSKLCEDWGLCYMDFVDPKILNKRQLPSLKFFILQVLFLFPNESLIIVNAQLSTHTWELANDVHSHF